MERFLSVTVVSVCLIFGLSTTFVGCGGGDRDMDGVPDYMDACPDGAPGDPSHNGCSEGGLGGPVDDAGRPVMQMPFAYGVRSQCTQGAGGSYSHDGWSTRYDVDLDTPNPPNDPFVVMAPVSGVVSVHNSGGAGFGLHVNVDLGTGVYAVIGHLRSVDVSTGEFVYQGERLGVAGCTGACTGDHVHLGMHEGPANQSADHGESVPSSVFALDATAGGSPRTWSTSDMDCGLSGGHVYESRNDQGAESEAHSEEDDPCEDDDDAAGDDDDDSYTPPADDDDAVGNDDDAIGDDDDMSDDDDATPDEPEDDGVVELCWLPIGLGSPQNGELWVQDDGWQTIASGSGLFSQLCGTVEAESNDVLVVNGEYTASNVPGNPWWICANGVGGHQIYGVFEVNGQVAASNLYIWGGGCDAVVIVP